MNKNNVPLIRRAITLILEVNCRPELIITLIICVIASPYLTALYTVLIVLFITIPIYILDQIVFPRKTGYTLSRYLLGFKILNSMPDKKLGYLQLFFRSSLIIGLESVGTALVSLVIIWLRDDKRSIHELLSKTYCVTTHRPRYYLLVLTLPLIVFQYCAIIYVGVSVFDNEIVKPYMINVTVDYPQVIQTEKEFVNLISNNTLATIAQFEATIESFDTIDVEHIGRPEDDWLGLIDPEEWTMLRAKKSIYCDSILFKQNPYTLLNPVKSIRTYIDRILGAVSIPKIKLGNELMYGCEENTLYHYYGIEKKSKKGHRIVSYEKYTRSEMITSIQVFDSNGVLIRRKDYGR